ncbi:MAG TPA: hypothetical protein VFW19_08795 [Allosphingosinicella sp.]|nr:hypothetical protein [Allosphingosinicella sp.]
MRRFAALLALALLLPGPAVRAADAPPPQRVVSMVVYGDDPCPKKSEGEIVICAHRPDNERYRIPKELRRREANETLSETSWASRVDGLEDAQRATRPGSCSPAGSWGQSGCFQQMISQWAAERRQLRSEADSIP